MASTSHRPQALFTTPKSLDSNSQTPISIFFLFLNGLYVSSPTSLAASKGQTPISIFTSLDGLSFFCSQLAATSHLRQAVFTTPKSLDSKSQTPISIFFLFLNGLYVSSPTSLVYDSKGLTPISILIFFDGLSFSVSNWPLHLISDKPCLRPPRAGPGGNRYPTVTELRRSTLKTHPFAHLKHHLISGFLRPAPRPLRLTSFAVITSA